MTTSTTTIVSTPGLSDGPFGGLAPSVTLHDVELCRVGQWNASLGGHVEITQQVIEQLAEASRDADADHVPIHPGHVDPRFPMLSDGEPAIGWVQNVRVVGDRLVGDLADVPARLAAIIPKAYRRRSVELAANVARPDGTVRPLALHGLGLLGVEMPAVKGLRDVVARYSTAPTAPTSQGTTLLLSDDAPQIPGGDSPSRHDGALSPQVPSTTPSLNPGGPPVARHTDERLRELLGLAGNADVTRLQNELTALPAAAQDAVIAQAAAAQAALAPGAPATAQAPQIASGQSATVAPTQTGTPASQAPIPAQATASTAPVPGAAGPAGGIVEGAPAHTPGAEQLVGALSAALGLNVPGSVPGSGAPALAQTAAPGQPAGHSPTDGGVYLSAGQMQALQGLLEQQNHERRQGTLAVALTQGRISPAERLAWEAELARDEAGATRLLNLFPANRHPVQALGSVGQANLSQHNAAAEAQYVAFEAGLGLDLPRAIQQQGAIGAPAAQPQIGA